MYMVTLPASKMYMKWDYSTIAGKLSFKIGKNVEPSQLEGLAQHGKNQINIAIGDGALTGTAIQKNGDYIATIEIRTPQNELYRVRVNDPSMGRSLKVNLRITLAGLAYLAENPQVGYEVRDGVIEACSID